VTTHRRWLPFVSVGALGFAFQLTVLGLMTRLTPTPYVLAVGIAVEAAILHNFFWHERWTWRDRRTGGPTAAALRLLRFNGASGLVSLIGNVVLTAALVEAWHLPVVVANVVAVGAMSLANFLVADRWVFRRLGRPVAAVAAFLVVAAAASAGAAELKPETSTAFDRYVAAAEARLAREETDGSRFLATDFEPSGTPAEVRARLRRGDIVVAPVDTTDADGRPIEVPSGMIHHWRGTIFIPGVSVDRIIEEVRNPSRRYRQEDVLEARITGRTENTDELFLKIQRQQIVTVAYNTEHLVTYARHRRGYATSRSVSQRIAEIENRGTTEEQEKPVGNDRGFLWRMNSYWKYQPYQDGVIVELESITLSRSLPWGVSAIARPIIDRVARESMSRTLTSFAARFAEDRQEPRQTARRATD
jgi:putative flippase GtrA